VMEKGIRPDIQHDEAAMLDDLQVVDGLERRLGLATSGPESAEIMSTDQRERRLAHTRHIQRPVVPGHFLGHMRRADRIVVDDIAIAPRHGAEARVKCAGITFAQVTLMSFGRFRLAPMIQACSGLSTRVSKCTTWPLAC